MMTEDDERLPDFPKSDDRSFGYEVARTTIDAAASFIPGGSYGVGKLVERFVAAPLQKRRDEWFERLGAGVQELERRFDGFDPATLEHNEEFVSSVFEATRIAMKTTNEERRLLLLHAVVNTAAGYEIEETLRDSFFACISRFTNGHVRVLKLLSDPSSSPEMVAAATTMFAGSQLTVLKAALPETLMPPDVLNRIFKDLSREGLADTSSLMPMGTSNMFLAKRSTSDGDAFLRFVAEPF